MNCEWYEEQISALIDHEVDDAQSAEIFSHLGTCPSCRSFLASTQRLRTILANHADTVPATLDARIRSISRMKVFGGVASILHRRMAWWKHQVAIPAPAFALLLLMLLMSAASVFGLLRKSSLHSEAQTPSVVYIMSLSPIEVEAQRITEPPHIH
jgi:anti-sigma factor RsiW